MFIIQSQDAIATGSFMVNQEGKKIDLNFDHGTTTLGFKYQGGVILAVDSRATSGQYIGKIYQSLLIFTIL